MSATQYLSSGGTALALDEFAILKKAIKIIAKTLDMFLFFNKKIRALHEYFYGYVKRL